MKELFELKALTKENFLGEAGRHLKGKSIFDNNETEWFICGAIGEDGSSDILIGETIASNTGPRTIWRPFKEDRYVAYIPFEQEPMEKIESEDATAKTYVVELTTNRHSPGRCDEIMNVFETKKDDTFVEFVCVDGARYLYLASSVIEMNIFPTELVEKLKAEKEEKDSQQ